MEKLDLLRSISFGESVAEQETDILSSYFVETEPWRQLSLGNIDVIYGAKGSGKSALYSLLLERESDFLVKKIILIPAENPRGTPAFRDLATDPPVAEPVFVGLWKLYFASLLHGVFIDRGMIGGDIKELESALAGEGLIRGRLSLQSLLRAVWDYTRWVARPKSLEAGVEVDATGQSPVAFKGKITFSEPSAEQVQAGQMSVDHLLDLANNILVTNSNFAVWILLDRLDVAFADNADLEQNALRALFRVYLDMFGSSNIRLKIFLRTDIWNRLSATGFREASHITKKMTIDWNRSSLLNLVVRRAMYNVNLRTFYGVAPEDVVSIDSQETFFYRIFPEKVDLGKRTPSTFDWILGRTRDATGKNAPREIIHLLKRICAVQIERFVIGEAVILNGRLFERAAFKAALPEVSKTRLELTLYAECPRLKPYLEQLRNKKTQYSIGSLSKIWGSSMGDTAMIVDDLVEAGFFEKRGRPPAAYQYKVPFLYRPALGLIQGSAEN